MGLESGMQEKVNQIAVRKPRGKMT